MSDSQRAERGGFLGLKDPGQRRSMDEEKVERGQYCLEKKKGEDSETVDEE